MQDNTKDWIQYSAGSAMIVAAISMGFISFAVTLEIGPGPLTYIGEMLSAALGLFGIGVYAKNKTEGIIKKIERRFQEYQSLEDRLKRLEENNDETDDNKQQG